MKQIILWTKQKIKCLFGYHSYELWWGKRLGFRFRPRVCSHCVYSPDESRYFSNDFQPYP